MGLGTRRGPQSRSQGESSVGTCKWAPIEVVTQSEGRTDSICQSCCFYLLGFEVLSPFLGHGSVKAKT